MGEFANNSLLEYIQDNDNVRSIPRFVTIIAAACAILFSVVGVLGNLITVIALLKYARLRKHATTSFVISLSISDLIFAAVNLPLTACRYLFEAWLLGNALCQIFPLFFYGNVAVSLLSMVAITLNRYVLISRSDLYPHIYTSKGIILMLVAIWTLSFSLLMPSLFGIWGQLGFDEKTFSCTILKKNGKSPKKLLFVLGFLVPCIVITVSYLCIYWRVRSSRKNLEAHTGGKKKGNGFQKREDSRVTRLMLTIFLCFVLCFMPLMIANVIEDKVKLPILDVIASILAWASSVINPFIYAGTNKLYREAYRQLLCRGSRRNPSLGPNKINSHSSKFSSQPT